MTHKNAFLNDNFRFTYLKMIKGNDEHFDKNECFSDEIKLSLNL